MSSADPCVLVVFGASGDLTRRKLLPALYNLGEAALLPERFAVVGVARSPKSEAEFRAEIETQLRADDGKPPADDTWARIGDRLHYLDGDLADPAFYVRLRDRLAELDGQYGTSGNYLFYLAVPPSAFAPIVARLSEAGLAAQRGGWRRVVIEKPFGRDLESARALNAALAAALSESQIYRIDHYLGKETVQNILAFRFANGIFEPIWNRRYVDHVQMTVAETVGIGRRGAYYDSTGALRDMVQNHMFQILTLVAMEPPISFRAEDVRNEKVKVLDAVQPFTPSEVRRHVVRGQYAGYRQEADVAPGSVTETFVALQIFVDNWRWADVPFFLRTGKQLPARATEIAVQFKRPPFMLFRHTPIRRLTPNVLKIRIQPNEGISLTFDAKVPGPFERLGTVKMDFSYADYFGTEPSTGYETLLHDAMAGDQTLFHRMDIVEAGWRVVQPVLEAWERDGAEPPRGYEPGTWGPPEADLLLERAERQWLC